MARTINSVVFLDVAPADEPAASIFVTVQENRTAYNL
jgi:hypothetical protein